MTQSDAAQSSHLQFRLNGEPVNVEATPSTRMNVVLREQLALKGTKNGCDAGDCGACSVLLNDELVCACMVPAARMSGAEILTVEGLASRSPLVDNLRRAFHELGAAQCGICTPGMLLSAVALLEHNSHPSPSEVEDALGGVLCRCTGYRKIVQAVCSASNFTASGIQLNSAVQVGKAIPRLDGLAKIDGKDRFGDDVAPSNTLMLKVIRSPYHRASFEIGDTEKFLSDHAGLSCIVSAQDIPGENCFGVIPAFRDQPVFAVKEARYQGEAIAAVVGTQASITALDLDKFPVVYTELPPMLTPEAAQQDGAPLVHHDRIGNMLTTGLVQRGDMETGFRACHVEAAGSFSTGFVEHAYIEPEAGYAQRVGDRLEIYGCTQAPYMDREELSRILNLAPQDIRIVPSAVGGGFGSKLDISFQPFVALAAWHLNHPVRMTYTRPESIVTTTKRHASELYARIGATQDGRLTAMDFSGEFNTGAYASWGPTVANRVPVHASGPYFFPNYRARSKAVHTHTAPAGAFRGFGVPQSAVAQEVLFDELAEKLNIDRLEFRRLNSIENGMPTVTGQTFSQGVGIKRCLDALRTRWQAVLTEVATFNQQQLGPTRRGVGVASCWYGCGNTSLPNPSTIRVGLSREGRVVLFQGAVDIGQGSNTVIAQICAHALGLDLSSFDLVHGDTDRTADAGKTSASRQTFVSGKAAQLAGADLRRKLLAHLKIAEPCQLRLENNRLTAISETGDVDIELAKLPADDEGLVFNGEGTFDPPTTPLDENGQGEPYATFGYGAQLVVVEVDIELGNVKAIEILAAHDVGQVINPVLAEGQIEGGIAQGIGMALMEEFVPGKTNNLHGYLIPTIGDIPDIDIVLIEDPDALGPFGAKGLGEHVLIPTAPAILNAIRHACGATVRKLPATPERVLAAIKEAR